MKIIALGDIHGRKMKQLEEENRKLKQLVADLSLDKHMLQEVIGKKLVPTKVGIQQDCHT
jgi:hypothetical protein